MPSGPRWTGPRRVKVVASKPRTDLPLSLGDTRTCAAQTFTLSQLSLRAAAGEALGVIRLRGGDVAAVAVVQPPMGGHAVRARQLSTGQGMGDALPDRALQLRLGGEQDSQVHLGPDSAGPAVVRRQGARRLVVPVPAQGRGDRRPRRAYVGAWLHDQHRLVDETLTHRASMPGVRVYPPVRTSARLKRTGRSSCS